MLYGFEGYYTLSTLRYKPYNIYARVYSFMFYVKFLTDVMSLMSTDVPTLGTISSPRGTL
jgi:hypothetical protein